MERVSKSEFSARVAQVRSGSYATPTRAAAAAAAAPAGESTTGRGVGASSNKNLSSTRQTREGSVVLNASSVPTVREYRGPSGISCAPPPRNVATSESELSLPLGPRKAHPENAHRTSHDITKHAEQGLLVGHGSVFAKELCTTSKGWSKGKF